MAGVEIKDAVFLFCMTSKSKEEAFLNGFLMGLGSHLACPVPNWGLIEKHPGSVNAEKHMREIYDGIHKKDITEARRLLAEYKEGKTKPNA